MPLAVWVMVDHEMCFAPNSFLVSESNARIYWSLCFVDREVLTVLIMVRMQMLFGSVVIFACITTTVVEQVHAVSSRESICGICVWRLF